MASLVCVGWWGVSDGAAVDLEAHRLRDALLGVGLGAFLRDQVGTVVALLVYLFVAEPIVTRIPALQDWTVYLPGPSASALARITLTDQSFLRPWQGGMVLALYCLGVISADLWRTTRLDLT